MYCQVTGHGRGQDQMAPGWAHSFAAALEPGASSWTQILDATRIGQDRPGPARTGQDRPGSARIGQDDDPAETTTAQLRAMVERLITAGQHPPGDTPVAVMTDSNHDLPRSPARVGGRQLDPAGVAPLGCALPSAGPDYLARASVHQDGAVTLTAALGGHRIPSDSVTLPDGTFGSWRFETLIADLLGLLQAVGTRTGSLEHEVRAGQARLVPVGTR
ncbi:transposase [Glycomyces mayteni]|uniref:Transposase n=1 Tax=Glycomyces mayteni TaxID=543887 RepID=A0ABW2D5E6_9ACTN